MVIVKLFLLFALGMLAIIKGADLFTDAAVWIAKKTGIPKVIIGATIVSIATTLPELAVSVFASWSGHSQMSLGNAVGSNIFNIGVILAISLIIRSFPTDQTVLSRAYFMIGGAILAYFLSFDGRLSRFDGVLLLLYLAGYIIYTFALPGKSDDSVEEKIEGTFQTNLLKFIGGSAAVVVGSRITVSSGIEIAHLFGVPEIIIGLTLVAMGTSLPELVTSLTATFKGYQELSVGNIIGAGILNMCWVSSTSSIVNPIPISHANLTVDFPVMLLLMILLVVFGKTQNRMTRIEGFTLFTIYVAYMTVLLGNMQ